MGAYLKVPIRPLETRRLILRPLALSDAPAIQAQFPHMNVLRYMASEIPWPYPEDGAAEYIASALPKVEKGERYLWAIVTRNAPDDGLIGVIELAPGSDDSHRGFWWAEPHWGHGYITEACTAVNDFAFDELEMEELILGNAEPKSGVPPRQGTLRGGDYRA